MAREYIKPFVFGLIGITQLMQCVMFSKEFHVDSSGTMGQDCLSKISEKVDPLKQACPDLLCVELGCLFQEGSKGLKSAIKSLQASMTDLNTLIESPKASMADLNRLGDKYFIISDGYIKVFGYNSNFDYEPLATLYPRIHVDHIDEAPLKKMRDSLYEPNDFKKLINHFLQKNYQVIIYASIAYPAFISIVLIHGIRLTKEQVNNMCIVFNDYNAIHKQNSFMCAEHIRHAELLTFSNPISHNKQVHGLVVSSYNPDAKLIERADCDYAFIRINPICQSSNSVAISPKFPKYWPKPLRRFYKPKYNELSCVPSCWNHVVQFEETRCELMREAEYDLNQSQSLLQENLKKWMGSIARDNKELHSEQLSVQSHALMWRSSVRTKKKSDLKQEPVQPSTRRYRSLMVKPEKATYSKPPLSTEDEKLNAQKHGEHNDLNPHSDLKKRENMIQQIKMECKRRKVRTICNIKLWQKFNIPWFGCVSFS